MEANEFDFAVEIFNQGSATLHPVSAVKVLDAVDHFDLGLVDMAADDAIGLMAAGHGGQRLFVLGDKFHRRLGLGF